MRLVLIRHGQTAGNALRRYIGATDQPLTDAGAAQARALGGISAVKQVFVTPLLRTRQTARLLFPDAEQTVLSELREMDFGDFEDRSADEMTDDAAYRAWVDGGCVAPCPGGESMADFAARVCAGFEAAIRALPDGTERAVFVVHGGTIMALVSRYARPEVAYYDAFSPNCGGWAGTLDRTPEGLILTNARRFDAPEEVLA